MELSKQELHCTATMMRSALFDGSLFYRCGCCEQREECMPEGIPHSDMVFDRVRAKLQAETGVYMGVFANPYES